MRVWPGRARVSWVIMSGQAPRSSAVAPGGAAAIGSPNGLESSRSEDASSLGRTLHGFTDVWLGSPTTPELSVDFVDHRSGGDDESLLQPGDFFDKSDFGLADHHVLGEFDENGDFLGTIRIFDDVGDVTDPLPAQIRRASNQPPHLGPRSNGSTPLASCPHRACRRTLIDQPQMPWPINTRRTDCSYRIYESPVSAESAAWRFPSWVASRFLPGGTALARQQCLKPSASTPPGAARQR